MPFFQCKGLCSEGLCISNADLNQTSSELCVRIGGADVTAYQPAQFGYEQHLRQELIPAI